MDLLTSWFHLFQRTCCLVPVYRTNVPVLTFLSSANNLSAKRLCAQTLSLLSSVSEEEKEEVKSESVYVNQG